MGTFELQTVAQLSTVIDDVCKALEQQDCAVPISAKKAIALRVVELYECGITDPDRLLLEIMADSLWASSSRSSSHNLGTVPEATSDNSKAKRQSLGLIERRLGKIQKRIHQQNNVIAAMMRRRLPTDDAERLLGSLLQTAETLRNEYDNLLCNDKQLTSERTRVQCATAQALIDEARECRNATTVRPGATNSRRKQQNPNTLLP